MEKNQTNNLLPEIDLSHGSGKGGQARQLQNSLREAVRRGQLKGGQRLPASRVLAESLGCSRWVVVQAYEQLTAEGYFVSTTGSGTYVNTLPQSPRRLESISPQPGVWRYDFGAGIPDLSAFPRKSWLAASRSSFEKAPHSVLNYGNPTGLVSLREEIAAYLGRIRGAVATASDLLLTTGAVHGVSILARALKARGIDSIAIEYPGWIPLREPLEGSDLNVIPVSVDHEGLDVDKLIASDARAVLVSPAHQFPIGSVLSPERRSRLLEWAEDVDGVIIEDDYDAEFRYDRQPMSTLQGMNPDRVLLLGSVSKSLSPGIRTGWIVAPPNWHEYIVGAIRNIDPSPAAINQLTLGEFISSGEFERHLYTMKKEYSLRRTVIIDFLEESPQKFVMSGAAAGLHILIDFGTGNAEDFSEAAKGRGINIYPLDRYCFNDEIPAVYENRKVMVLGYGGIRTYQIISGLKELISISNSLN